MVKQILISIILCLVIISCGDDVEPDGFEFDLEHEFLLNKPNNSVDNSLRFKLTDMQESRCPEGVYCIWQGEAKFKVIVELPTQDTFVLSTHNMTSGSSQEFNFELISVSPYPDLNTEIKPEDYRIKLVITN